jgi:hypothetical protein
MVNQRHQPRIPARCPTHPAHGTGAGVRGVDGRPNAEDIHTDLASRYPGRSKAKTTPKPV